MIIVREYTSNDGSKHFKLCDLYAKYTWPLHNGKKFDSFVKAVLYQRAKNLLKVESVKTAGGL